MVAKLNSDIVSGLRIAFYRLKVKRAGFLSKKQLFELLEQSGVDPSSEMVFMIINLSEKRNDKLIKFEQFISEATKNNQYLHNNKFQATQAVSPLQNSDSDVPSVEISTPRSNAISGKWPMKATKSKVIQKIKALKR